MPPSIQPEMQQNTSLDLKRIGDFLAQRGRPDYYPVVDYYPVIDSTMRVAHSLAMREGIRSGSVVVADEQSAGRGRLGRTWEAPAGSSLLMSIVLREMEAVMYDWRQLPMVCGLAVQRTIAALQIPNVEVGIKWPNDVLLRGADGVERKVAGVLMESTIVNEGMRGHVVVGFGINVTQTEAQLPQVEPPAPQPTSLLLAGARIDRTELLIELWQYFYDCYGLSPYGMPSNGDDPLLMAWRDVLWTLGRRVTVYHADGDQIEGTAVDVAEYGALIVEDDQGVRHTVHSGDVSMHASAA